MKTDYKKEYSKVYNASPKDIQIIQVPKLSFLRVEGEGDPNTSPNFKNAVEALYSLSYASRNITKRQNQEHVVMPLEGLWWADDMRAFDIGNKGAWKWILMIMQPGYVDSGVMHEAFNYCAKKKELPFLPKVKLEAFEEGLSVQILHQGPFSEEGPTIEKLHQFIDKQGYVKAGKHHEIYLNDFRKVLPEKIKTILRQPIQSK
ncbi:MAG: GyrI-like domain-containing protein [Clostridia bacterium]|nr:GyrI-like domain-containing protein [Clostridia bacterium]